MNMHFNRDYNVTVLRVHVASSPLFCDLCTFAFVFLSLALSRSTRPVSESKQLHYHTSKKRSTNKTFCGHSMRRVTFSKLRANALGLACLPTPKLTHTFEQYSKSVRPIKKGAAVDLHFDRLNRFTSGSASELQKRLDSIPSRNDSSSSASWGTWRDDEILRQRYPLPIRSNTAVGLKKFGAVDASAYDSHVVLRKVTQSELAAHLAHSVTKFIRHCASEGIDVDADCDPSNLADQFCSARVPHTDRDSVSRGDWATDASHIVVLRDGHVYFVNVVCPTTGTLVDVKSLTAAFDHVLITTPLSNNSCPVSAMTSLPRDEAAAAFQLLAKESPKNAEAIKAVEKAIVVICLDTETWPTPEVKQQFMLFGSGAEAESRWYHKNQIIVSADAEVAINFERSLSDNHASKIWCNAVFNDVQHSLLAGFAEQASFPALRAVDVVSVEPKSLVRPFEVVFGKSSAANIRSAKETARQLSESVSVDYVRIPLSSNAVHPDAFMQICFQLAYFIQHRRSAATTQEISLSSFFCGGMAYIRTGMPIVQPFLDLWARSEKEPGAVSPAMLAEALFNINAHYLAKVAEVGKGLGVGEHLHALEYVACVEESRNPRYADAREFFSDPLFKAWDTPIMATGGMSAPYVDSYSIGPQVQDGFGLGYVVHPSYVIVNITSFHEDKIADFRDSIAKASKILGKILASSTV